MQAVNLFNRFGMAAAAVALAAVSTGCATFRDVRRDFQNLFSGRSDAARTDPEDAFDAMGQRRPGRVISRDFNPRNLPATVRVITAMGENQAAAQQALEAGLALYRRAVKSRQAGETAQAAQRFQDAGNKLREAAAHWPDSPLEQDALFYQGEAFFFADQYVLADRAFEAITHSYSGSKYVDAANARRFAIAQYWLAVHDRGRLATWFNFSDKRLPTASAAAEARRILHRIRLDDPTGKLADDATIALGNAFFKAHR